MTQVNTTPNDFEARHLIANDDGLKIWGFDDALEATMPKGPQGAGAFRCVAPWPAVLEHAPTAELVAALHNRRDVDWSDVLECTPVEEMEREIKNRDADAKAWAMEH